MLPFRHVLLSALSVLALNATAISAAHAEDNSKELEKRFAEADKNNDGKLTPEEAKAMPRVSSNFGRIDKAKLGYITLDQLKAMSK